MVVYLVSELPRLACMVSKSQPLKVVQQDVYQQATVPVASVSQCSSTHTKHHFISQMCLPGSELY